MIIFEFSKFHHPHTSTEKFNHTFQFQQKLPSIQTCKIHFFVNPTCSTEFVRKQTHTRLGSNLTHLSHKPILTHQPHVISHLPMSHINLTQLGRVDINLIHTSLTNPLTQLFSQTLTHQSPRATSIQHNSGRLGQTSVLPVAHQSKTT